MSKITIVFLTTFVLLSLSMQGFATKTISGDEIKRGIYEVYEKYKNNREGKNADYIPELSKVKPALFGITIVTVKGDTYSIGDSSIPFAIESISKPFVYALALHDNGEKTLTEKIGLNATGHSFNSLISIEEKPDHLQNPLVNAGAIQVTSFIKGDNNSDKWTRVFNFIKKLSDGKPYLGEEVYLSEKTTNQHNRALAELLNSYGIMGGDTLDALDRYTKACSIMMNTYQLALMGATLANNGIHPLSHQRIISSQYVKDVLSQMLINGLYENSGAWFWTVGIPAKSGVGGGLLAVVPNKMAIAVYSPPLDEAGNSVRAQKVIKDLSHQWNLHLLNSTHFE